MITVGAPADAGNSTPAELCFGDEMTPPRAFAIARDPADAWEFLRPALTLAKPGATPSTVWTTLRPPR